MVGMKIADYFAHFRNQMLSGICNYWKVENMGAVTAKLDEQKTDETKQKILELVGHL